MILGFRLASKIVFRRHENSSIADAIFGLHKMPGDAPSRGMMMDTA